MAQEISYLLLSDAAQDHYLDKRDHRVEHSGADKYEVVKSLAFSALIEDKLRRIQRQPIGDADHKWKCDRRGIEDREYEESLRVSVS